MYGRLAISIAVLTVACYCGCQSESGSGTAAGTGDAGPARPAGRPGPMEVSREQLAALDEMTAALQKIQDDASAAAVLPDLRKAAGRLRSANEQMIALQRDMQNTDSAKAADMVKDPEVRQQIDRVMDATGRMMAANLDAQLKAPGKRGEIQAACDSANVPTSRKPPIPRKGPPDPSSK